jgi:glycosyltransferase involved in cell wall biosynthesis
VKVLHIHKLTGVSGSEAHLLALLAGLRAAGIDARFLGLDVAGTDAPLFYERLDGLGVPYRRVRCGPDLSPRMARDVIRAVREERPDLLHTHLVHADVYGSIAARTTRTPFVSTRHNDDRYLLGPFRYVDRAFARGARKLIAISDAVRDFLVAAGHDPRKLVTIRYGLDEPPPHASHPSPVEAGVPARAPLALAVGRLIEQKDHETLLRAFALVHAEQPDAWLAILG